MSDKTPFVNLGQQLRRTREKSNQSLAEVSGAVEIDETALERIEAGVERPAEDILLLLISHFGVQENEALKLWQLANYDSELPDQLRPDIDLVTGSKVVMLMALDMRTIYSDGLAIESTDGGMTLQFTQSSGKPVPNPVARIGISYDQAEIILKQLGQALIQKRYGGKNLSLNSGDNADSKTK